ncbi:bifunctional DedA family/phosphatase PAP2 family protein [Pseudomonas panipatensis]|uniref:bifunctional DedA family/phosphatase PAP2 family protein n=1 Tax=Pseudomonas panipatensis TaxID=428992 RepID=UPI0035AEC7A2
MLSSLIAFITEHPQLTYAVVLLLALSESIPVIGAVVPGTAVIIAISALVPSGAVTLWPLLAAAVAGAILGDGLSYWVGHRYHREVLNARVFKRFSGFIARSELFFTRHGGKSVFLARFTPGVRAFVPLLAGVLKMPPGRFYAANLLSALTWAPVHILPGVLIGASFSLFGAAAKPLAALVVLLVLLVWGTSHLVRFTLARGLPLLSGALQRLRTWAAARDDRWARLILNLLDPARPDARGLAYLAVLLVGSAWLFFGILEDVVSGDPLVRADSAIYLALQDLRTAPGDALMIAMTELGDTVVVLAVTLAVLLWLAGKRAWRTAAYWLVAIAGASALNSVIKVALHRPRPGEMLYTGWSAFSFPSGHSTVNAILYGFLAVLLIPALRPLWRLPLAVCAVTLVLGIAMSRLYLGAHWFSDVVGGLAFACAWLTSLGVSYRRKPAQAVGAVGLLIVAIATLSLAGGLHIHRQHAFDVARYAQQERTQRMSTQTWWNTGWQQLPARRVEITGEIEEPLALQWAGSLSALQALLQRQGWYRPVPWSASGALAWLAPSAAPGERPLIAVFAGGRLPELTLALADPDAAEASRFVLRLWPADVTLDEGDSASLWVGSVVEERLVHYLSLLTLEWRQPDMNRARDRLLASLATSRLATRSDAASSAHWDGRVVLAHDSDVRTDARAGVPLPGANAPAPPLVSP